MSKGFNELLTKAVEKQIELNNKSEWKKELLPKAPPVLWFGNMLSSKTKVATIGANPSREEFLAIHRNEAEKYINDNKSLDDLPYLQGEKERFRALKEDENITDILHRDLLQNEIISSYNKYFFKGRNPYGSWFGKNGKIEAFLNGIDASYYEKDAYTHRAIHTDFFPFATISNFKSLQDTVENDLFKNFWAQELLLDTLDIINPDKIIVFGRTNTEVFKKLFHKDLVELSQGEFASVESTETYSIHKFKNKYLLIMVSTYLADARGFTSEMLLGMGQELNNVIKNKGL